MSAPTVDLSAEREAIATLAAHNDALDLQKTMTERLRTEAAAADKAKAVALATSGAKGDAAAVSAALLACSAAGHALDVAEQVLSAMEGRAADLRKAVLEAHAQSFAPLMRHAAAEALAACTDARTAIAAHGEAVIRYERAAKLAHQATAAGLRPPYGDGGRIAPRPRHFTRPLPLALSKELRLPEEEMGLWQGYAS